MARCHHSGTIDRHGSVQRSDWSGESQKAVTVDLWLFAVSRLEEFGFLSFFFGERFRFISRGF